VADVYEAKEPVGVILKNPIFSFTEETLTTTTRRRSVFHVSTDRLF
jgi:hypothetical protein